MYRRVSGLRPSQAGRRREGDVVMAMRRGSGTMGVASWGSDKVVRCERLWVKSRLHRALLSIHSFRQYMRLRTSGGRSCGVGSGAVYSPVHSAVVAS